MALTLRKEEGCISARATKQITHPGAPGKSKYTIILLQEYINLKAFDIHCASEHVANAFKELIENKKTSIVSKGRVRLFGDDQ